MIPILLLAVIAQEQPVVGDITFEFQRDLTKLEMHVAESVLDAYRKDVGALPMDDDSVVPVDVLAAKLERSHERRLPTKDAWGHPLRCWLVRGELILTNDGPDGLRAYNPFRPRGEPGVSGDDLILQYGRFPDPLRHTMDILDHVGRTFEAYHRERGVYPGPTNGLVPLSRLQDLLNRPESGEVATRDGWGNPILVVSVPTGFVVVSWGSNGRPEGNYDPADTSTWPNGGGGIITPERDLLLMNGQFTRESR